MTDSVHGLKAHLSGVGTGCPVFACVCKTIYSSGRLFYMWIQVNVIIFILFSKESSDMTRETSQALLMPCGRAKLVISFLVVLHHTHTPPPPRAQRRKKKEKERKSN